MDERIKNETPLMEGMWTVRDDKVYLLASVCEACEEVYFPQKEVEVCSHCQGEKLKTVELSREGFVKSFSVVHQPPRRWLLQRQGSFYLWSCSASG